MSTTTSDSWHANQRDYDEYQTPDVDSRAELFGRLKQLVDQYEHVVVVAQHRPNGPHHNREVNADALSYDPDRNTLDIYGRPATGRFARPETFIGFKVWE